ncbi:transmembrane protein 87A-like isoform X2 [Littorina saxatilis]|uniref:transmembrane protein 87A-like isoform X2 n=1 Tax=Littorina saxatilis TaxID=31220 RepID=UPI0038B4763B
MATVVIILAVICASVSAIPEQGKWIVSLDQDHEYSAVAKHMYKDSKVTVSVSLTCDDPDELEFAWLLRMSPCAMEFVTATEEVNSNKDQGAIESYFNNPITYYEMPYDKVELKRGVERMNCSKGEKDREFKLTGDPNQEVTIIDIPKLSKNDSSSVDKPAADTVKVPDTAPAASNTPVPPQAPKTRKKRATADAPQPTGTTKKPNALTEAPKLVTTTTVGPSIHKMDHEVLAKTWADGNYLFILKIKPKKLETTFSAEVTIRMFYGDENFISALDYPLLIFYGILGLVYIVYGLIWLVLLACNWRDLLRVQFWIGGVILLGMLEKAVFFGEYENINKTGESVHGAVIFAELVSCMKRTLARMLVIIVSLGFGIVKPRLGQAFHKVLFVGGLFFVLAAIEGCMRATSVDQSNQFLLAAVPLAVLDAIICWWIFSSLIQTTRTLRLRRNVVKLTLYRHFTNTLIFNVLASVAYMIWFMTQHKFKECIKDWKQLWVDEAFWHMLFVVLVLIIMLLWRPTVNNQRYAFSPLLDAADEEDEDDMTMNDAFDGMKMRGVKNGSPKQRDQKNRVEDDLRWVEENIPSSVADKALPTLLDSDEELMTTKFEMSKME